MKPLYTDSLKSWVGHIPDDVMADLPKIAPMMKTLGYDVHSKDPHYGKPDQEVQDKYDGKSSPKTTLLITFFLAWLKTQK